MDRTAKELADYTGAQLEGDGNMRISGCASPESAGPHDIIFVDSAKHLGAATRSKAGCIVLAPGEGTVADLPGKAILRAKDPKLAFARIIAWMIPAEPIAQGIHSTAIVSPKAKLSEGVAVGPYAVIEEGVQIGGGSQIGAHCFVGRDCHIGAECKFYPRVTLYHGMRVGARVVIHSGAVIGSDGFGFVPTENGFVKFPQIGRVEIDDDVEIGANTTIDRGALDATKISRGVKLDNLVQIGHNSVVGEHSAVSAQAGLAGSTIIGRNVLLGGQVGIAGHGRIEDGAQLAPQTGVPAGKVIRAGTIMFGSPARPIEKAKVIIALMGRLPDLVEKIRRLEEKVFQKAS
jgi:UDP-3-O-[3-hydroxymyristoyl] glucosamine N-acyltransferase